MGEGEATKTNLDVGNPNNKSNDHYYNHHKKPRTSKKKKYMFKGSLMNVIKVVLYMLKRKGNKTGKKLPPSLSTTTNATLKSFVGAFRPFHLQRDIDGKSASPVPQLLDSKDEVINKVDEVMISSPENDKFEASPNHSKYDSSSFSSSSSRGDISRYASAKSLHDIDDIEEDEDSDEEEGMIIDGDAYYDGLVGDDMIDAKADKFIAKFYQQMRLQNI